MGKGHDERRSTIRTRVSLMGTDKEIKPRINKSLVQLDLDELIVLPSLKALDLKEWLWQGLVVKEDLFREKVEAHDWKQYQDADVSIDCSEDAIIPTWAYMLVAAKASEYALNIYKGNLLDAKTKQMLAALESFDFSQYQDARIVLKGCASVTEEVFMAFVMQARPYAKSILFGELCSTVPVYKK